MSVVIVAMTRQCVIVATDSRMTTPDGHSTFKKLYTYNDTIVSYGVGNAGIVYGFYNTLDRIKRKEGNRITYDNLIDTLNEYKAWIESNPIYSKLFACIGICGIVGRAPISTAIGIGDMPQYKNITTPKNDLTFYIIPPEDLEHNQCNEMFIYNCQRTFATIDEALLLKACIETIYQVSLFSSAVDSDVHYWLYNLSSHQSRSGSCDSLRREFCGMNRPTSDLYIDSNGHIHLR